MAEQKVSVNDVVMQIQDAVNFMRNQIILLSRENEELKKQLADMKAKDGSE